MAESELTITVLGNAVEALKSLREVGKASKEAGKEGGSIGGKIAHGLGGALKAGVFTVGAAAGGVLGTALFKGFNRLNAIEDAQAKLKGLGNSTKQVKVIMDNALKSVLGTSFGLGEAATTAASAVAAGITPGKKLKGYLDSVANAAASSGMSMRDMGNIFNQVAAQGKAHNDILEQVANRGIPIYTALAKVLHTTGDNVFDMAKKGKIGLKEFQKGMDLATGTVAKELGDTMTGRFDNLGAAMSRFGVSILEDFAPMITKGLGSATKMFDRLTKVTGPVMKRVAEGVQIFWNALRGKSEVGEFEGAMRKVNDLGANLYDFFLKARAAATAFWQGLTQGVGACSAIGGGFSQLRQLGMVLRGAFVNIVSAAKNLWAAFGPLIMEMGNAIFTQAPSTFKLIMFAIQLLSGAIQKASAFMLQHQTVFKALIVAVMAGYAAYRTFSLGMKIGMAVSKAFAATQILVTSGINAAAKASKIYAVVQRGLNMVMRMNPIGLVITALAALAAGLIYAYQHSETFRNIVNGAFKAVAGIAAWLWGQVRVNLIGPILRGFAWVTDGIANFLGALGHIPGFGWATTAANKMHAAARAARDMAAGIEDIHGKSVTITVVHRDYFVATHTVQGVAVPTHVKRKGYASGGTNIPAGLAWVGEQGPELMYVPGGSTIWDARKSKEMAKRKPNLSALGGGDVIVHITVQGSIWAAKDLAKELVNPMRDELVKVGKRNGGNIFPQ